MNKNIREIFVFLLNRIELRNLFGLDFSEKSKNIVDLNLLRTYYCRADLVSTTWSLCWRPGLQVQSEIYMNDLV